MKTFRVQVDVTMSGDIEIKANTKKEAREIVKQKSFVPSDLRTFSHIKTSVVDIQE